MLFRSSLGVLLSLSLAGCDKGKIEDIQTEDFYAANPDKAKSVSEACALADLSKESPEIYDNCERAAMAYFKIFYKSMMQSVSRQEVPASAIERALAQLDPAVREDLELSIMKAGAGDVKVLEESLVAAIGANIPIHEPAGNMVCDIGGGTTEVSVISLCGMVVTNAIRVGGDEFDQAIIKHVRSVDNLIR